MRVVAIFSGGKDSTYAVYKAMRAGHTISYLLTLKPRKEDSYMFHFPCVELTKLQAKVMRIPQIFFEVSGEKEKEVEELKKLLLGIRGIDGVVCGALASNYQKKRIEKVCEELNLECLTPLWGIDTKKYWDKLLDDGFEIMITSVSCDGLTKEWLGRIITREDVKKLKKISEKYGMDLGFEGGEAETFVVDCPLFKGRIEIVDFDIVWDEKTSSGYINVLSAEVLQKR